MHSLRSKWFAVLLAYIFMFAAYGHSPAAELPQTGALAPAEALQLMDTLGDKLTVIDVRTEQEYAQGHVPGALIIGGTQLAVIAGSLLNIRTAKSLSA